MDSAAFETDLRNSGYTDIATRTLDPNHATTPHAHPFEVLAMVLDGEISLGVKGVTTSYKKGEIFTMANGCEHTETVGPGGVTTIGGKKFS